MSPNGETPGQEDHEETEISADTGTEQLDLEQERRQYLEDAHEQSEIFTHKRITVGNNNQTIPEHILAYKEKKEKKVPTKELKKELTLNIASLYNTEGAQRMIIDGLIVEKGIISQKFDEPEIERIMDLPNPEQYKEYRDLVKSRDQNQAAIEYLTEMEVELKRDAELHEKQVADLLDDYESRNYTFTIASQVTEGTLRMVLPRMIEDIEYSKSYGEKHDRKPAEKARITDDYKDALRRRYSIDELKIISQTLRAKGRYPEADALDRFI